jgi:hypothetical protein
VEEGFLEDDDYKNLYNAIIEEFNDDNLLLAKDEKKFGYLVFLPFIDSLSCLEERLNKLSERCIVTKHEAGGTAVAVCKVACVIYPYSDIKDILPDLRYAARQEKDVNVYLPKRLNKVDKHIYHTSLNLNNVSHLFEYLSKTRIESDSVSKAKDSFHKV